MLELRLVRLLVWNRAARRRHCVGGGAPVNFGRRRRRAAGPKKSAAARRGRPKHFFLRFTKKFRSILKIFLGTVLVIKALRFADDQSMLAGSESDLRRMMDRLNMVSVNYNMKINTKKTKVMRVSKRSESALKIDAGEIIQQVKEFCYMYLGSMTSDDATEKLREG